MKKFIVILVLLCSVTAFGASIYPLPTVGDVDTWGTDLNNYLNANKGGINVKEYGAVGDDAGTADGSLLDNTAALTNAFAAAGDKYLIFESNKVYKVTTSLVVPEGCTVELNGSKVVFIVDGATRDFDLRSNTTIRNGLIENAGTNFTSGGNFQAPILIGALDAGTGYQNIVLENLELETNRSDGNGNLCLITGDSSNIRISNIIVRSTSAATAIFNIHWGGSASGSFHPHDINISGIKCDGMSKTSSALIHVRGGYDVTVTGVEADGCYNGFLTLPGDAGRDFVSDASEAGKIGRGISFTNCAINDITNNAIFLHGLANQGATTKSTTDLDMPVSFRNCYFHGGSTSNGSGTTLGTSRGVVIDHCTFDRFLLNGINIAEDVAQNVTITNCEILNNGKTGISQGASGGSAYVGNNHVIQNNYIHGNNTGINADGNPHKGGSNAGLYVTGDYWMVDNNIFGEPVLSIATATAGAEGAGSFTVSSVSDLTKFFPAGKTLYVTDSDSGTNDGTYIVSTTFPPTYVAATDTFTLFTVEAIAGGVDDGNIHSETQEYSVYVNDNIQHTRMTNNTTYDVHNTAYYNGRDAVRQGVLTSGFNNTTLDGTLFGGTYIPKTEIIAQTIPVMVDTDATPTVQGTDSLRSLGVTAITDFDDGVEGQTFTFFAETTINITDGTNILLSAGGTWTMTDTDTLTLTQKADGKWYEVSRGDNGA